MFHENLKGPGSMKRLQLLLLIAALGACRPSTDRQPTDDELLARFRAHRTELDQLVRMFQADKGLERVGESFTRPDDPSRVNVSSQRIEEYRRLCATVGAPKCIEGVDAEYYRLIGDGRVPPDATEVKNLISVRVYGWGSATTAGGGKGYLYFTGAPAFEIVPNLDHLPVTRQPKRWIRHIEGAWYLDYSFAP